MSHWIAIGLLVIAAAVLMFADNPGKALGIEDEALGSLVMGLTLVGVLASSLVFSYRGRIGLAFKQALAWVAIGLTLVAVYSYRVEFMALGARITGELVPGTPVAIAPHDNSNNPGVVAISANVSGHFSANAMINNTHVEFLVDTGATVVALTHVDAQRIGIDVAALRFSTPVRTANGRTFSAPVRLKLIEIGSIRAANVRALVSKPGVLHKSLLGMSFLKKISSFEISGNRLILRQ